MNSEHLTSSITIGKRKKEDELKKKEQKLSQDEQWAIHKMVDHDVKVRSLCRKLVSYDFMYENLAFEGGGMKMYAHIGFSEVSYQFVLYFGGMEPMDACTL